MSGNSNIARGWSTPEYWKGSFAFSINELLDQQSQLAINQPHLFQVLRDRLQTALAAREHRPVSLCPHTTFSHGYRSSPSDSVDFQKDEYLEYLDHFDPLQNTTRGRVQNMCGSLQETIDVYGLAGEGTFGSVFLGRERNGGVANPEDLRHYAIKVEKHLTLLDALQQSFWNPPMAQVPNPHTHYQTFIPSEALVLLFLTDSDRFPTLDSVYTHDRFQAIVMSPCTDYDPDQAPQGGRDYQRQFPAFNGHYLLTETRRPLLDSRGACKVSAQFVEAVTHMADMNLWHGDISVNNFIVDKVLNVQVLDLAEVTFGLHEKEFFNRQYMFVPFQEYQMSPELASHMSTFTGDHCSGIDMGHDLRRETLWKLGVIVYGIVHGFWPWDFPLAPGSHPDLLSPSAYSSPRRIHSRRDRILNEPLRINENLPQDCRDVLQAMLSQNTEDRPTLAELEAYPWFSQWVHETQFWERPLSQAFRDSYTTQIYT